MNVKSRNYDFKMDLKAPTDRWFRAVVDADDDGPIAISRWCRVKIDFGTGTVEMNMTNSCDYPNRIV